MTESAATSSSGHNVHTHPDDNRRVARRRARAVPTLPLPRQLARGELIDLIAAAPSREGKRFPRADLRDNVGRLYDALWRHARARGTARYRLTHRQLAAAAGYENWSYHAAQLTSIQRYIAMLEEIGVVRISGRDELADGRTCVVILLSPPEPLESAEHGRRSSAGFPPCDAVRRPEKRSETQEWRRRPYCPKGGRGQAVERWSFSLAPYVGCQGLVPPTGRPDSDKPCVGASGGPPGGGLSDATGPELRPPPIAQHPAGPPEACAGDRRRPPERSAATRPPSPRRVAGLDRGAAFAAARAAAARGGVDGLRQFAREGGDPIVVGIVGWELLYDGPPRLSARRRAQLERSARIVDRVHDELGAGAAHLLRLLEIHAERLEVLGEEEGTEKPGSLSYFVCQLRADARHWRQAWRARRARLAAGAPGSDRGEPGA